MPLREAQKVILATWKNSARSARHHEPARKKSDNMETILVTMEATAKMP
jgi:hypothetical protein